MEDLYKRLQEKRDYLFEKTLILHEVIGIMRVRAEKSEEGELKDFAQETLDYINESLAKIKKEFNQ